MPAGAWVSARTNQFRRDLPLIVSLFVLRCGLLGIQVQPAAEHPYVTWPRAQGNVANASIVMCSMLRHLVAQADGGTGFERGWQTLLGQHGAQEHLSYADHRRLARGRCKSVSTSQTVSLTLLIGSARFVDERIC